MEYLIEDFIGVFKNALSKEECDQIIDLYESSRKFGSVTNRQQYDNTPRMIKDTDFLWLNKQHMRDEMLFKKGEFAMQVFTQRTWECYVHYAKKYGILDALPRHQLYDDVKVQKTEPSQGYHVWHCEHSSRLFGSRLALVIAYLNDVEDGGETEFLYQSKRIKPERGTLIICPSGFTHTHRGNPPLSGVKYIINGWIEFTE